MSKNSKLWKCTWARMFGSGTALVRAGSKEEAIKFLNFKEGSYAMKTLSIKPVTKEEGILMQSATGHM